MVKKKKDEVISIITKTEASAFKQISYQKNALLELLGLVKEKELRFWEALTKEYGLKDLGGAFHIEVKSGKLIRGFGGQGDVNKP